LTFRLFLIVASFLTFLHRWHKEPPGVAGAGHTVHWPLARRAASSAFAQALSLAAQSPQCLLPALAGASQQMHRPRATRIAVNFRVYSAFVAAAPYLPPA
jgi:hypothetical protein